MGVTFSIAGTSFAAIGPTDGRKALFIRVPAPEHEIHRYSLPGVDGNYKLRSGRRNQRIVAIARYQGTDPQGLYATDREAFANTDVTIVDDGGVSLDRCELRTMQRETDPVGYGTGQSYFDVIMTFDRDGIAP